ncbi:MAG TPA: CxxC-x17-CxxC domain-containing protein [Candidatus Paceibacterota bacterium]
MNTYNKDRSFGGGYKGGFKGGFRGERGGFGGKKNFGGGFDGPKEMFTATCASCGKPCEVPFRPNGKKPVYCNDCFAKNGGPSNGDSFQKKSFAPRGADTRGHSHVAPDQSQSHARAFADMTKQLETLNTKFDRLMVLAEQLMKKDDALEAAVSATEDKPAPAKKRSKKATA